jgi:nucleotide-binding universal stress UspA family protein
MKILVIYDGTIHSKTALRYGLRKAKEKDGEVIVLQVFQSRLFVDYDAGPKAEEIARAEASRHLRDAETIIRESGRHGIPVRVLSEEGDTIEEAVRLAQAEHADMILSTPRYKAITRQAPCPVYIMPGTILVPVDSSDALMEDKDTIIEEAKATGSKVLLLGIVPVHLYSTSETAELEQVKKGTTATVMNIKNILIEQRIEVSETIRSGYLDEEILKAAAEFSVSLIMLPAGGKTPSELTKAAIILLDEPERVHMPIQFMQTAEAS